MNLAWIDIETTGLNPQKDFILEIGVIITKNDISFQELDRVNWILPFDAHLVNTKDVDDFVVDMHARNGLWEECHEQYLGTWHKPKAMQYPNALEREAQIMQYLDFWSAEKSPMCGSTPHFDRSFLQVRYPSLEALFHYRNFDVSSFNQLAVLVDPDWQSVKREMHRALPDLDDSISTMRKFVKRFDFDRWTPELPHPASRYSGDDVT